jgi:1-acyl-sn-glycerol-3-phosphate acyltransferase
LNDSSRTLAGTSSAAPAPAPASAQPAELITCRGSRVARGLLALCGWRVDFAGLPARQGVVVVYPHTSNWDFIVGMLAKWTMGLDAKFWGKDSLFRVPVFGAWMRWLGGVAVNRSSASGLVGHTVNEMLAARAEQRLFWLVLAPEGTRSLTPGWRSGFYRVAQGAQVPVLIATIDYAQRCVRVRDCVKLSGDAERDMAEIARRVGEVRGYRPALAAPITLR